jgi:hypothetical protein
VSRREFCARCDQHFDDFDVTFRIVTMGCRPECVAQDCSSVDILRFKMRISLQQKLDYFKMAADDGAVQSGLTVAAV